MKIWQLILTIVLALAAFVNFMISMSSDHVAVTETLTDVVQIKGAIARAAGSVCFVVSLVGLAVLSQGRKEG